MVYSYEKFLKQLGEAVRKMRIERGWTYRHLIAEYGYHLAHWQKIEKGRGLSVPSLLRLAELFDMPVEKLIAGMGVVEPESTAEGGTQTEVADDSPRIGSGPAQSTKVGSSPSASSPRRPRRLPRA